MQFEFSRYFTWLGSVSRLPLFSFLYTVFRGSSKTTELNTFFYQRAKLQGFTFYFVVVVVVVVVVVLLLVVLLVVRIDVSQIKAF
jgi:hypothetical protein